METRANFQPLPWQISAWRDKSLTMLLTGSAGGGKSRLAAEKIHGACMKYPGATWLVMRKAREWNKTSIIPFMWETVIQGTGEARLHISDGAFYYTNGSRIYTGGMKDEEQREAVRSIGGAGGLDGAWMEEGTAFTRKDYNEVLARMRHDAMGWRQIVVTTNPGPPMHWVYTDLIKGKQATVFYSGAKDNPHNPDEYLDILNRLTGVQRERLVMGLWKQAEGTVYDKFDYAVHVRERQHSDFQYWVIGIDPGYTNPTSMGLTGIDSDGRLHDCEEVYRTGMLHEHIVAQAWEWYRQRPINTVIVVDESAAELIAELKNAGMRVEGHKGKVLDGIAIVQGLLVVQGDGLPRYSIDPTCTSGIQEFEGYIWKEGRDEPVKQNDHSMDRIRYTAHWLYGEEFIQRQYIYQPARIG